MSPENRDDTTNKDAKLINAYVETAGEEIHVYKRPGLSEASNLGGAGRGVYQWRGGLYAVNGTTFYKDGVSKGTVDGTNGVYRFSENLGSTPKLQLGNGVKAYNYDDTSGLVEITDPDFPTSFVKGWAYLDGTTYVMTPSAAIQGSELNNTVDWDPLNVIIAQIEPDQGIALADQLVYVIAFKQWSTEVFYDAANPTGSPLGTVQGAKVNYGCISSDSVRDMDGMLLWAATSQQAGVQILMMDNLKAQIVSTKPVERLLQFATWTAGNVFSWVLKINGHRFYGLTLKANNLTLVYDIDDKRWAQWTDTNGNYFPVVDATTTTSFGHVMQHETDGKLYSVSSDNLLDGTGLISVDIYTPNFDGGTRRKKNMNFMEYIGDQVVGSELFVRVNDYDYNPQRWTNFRKMDLSTQRAFLTNCGTFRRRAMHLRHRANTKFRIQAVEMQLDLGSL